MQRIDRNTMEAGVESIFKMLAQRVDDKQMQLVRNAYELAAEAHKEQKRKTGEPYITHPIAVARIVAEELELGANPVMAAFLHDVVEDTKYTIEDIRERFGEDVAFLVGVVTKQKKEKYDKSKQVERYGNYNKLNSELHPMAYWQGDTCHDVLLTDRDEE